MEYQCEICGKAPCRFPCECDQARAELEREQFEQEQYEIEQREMEEHFRRHPHG